MSEPAKENKPAEKEGFTKIVNNTLEAAGNIIKGEGAVSATEARNVVLLTSLLTAVGTSVYTRKRVAAGAKPIAKFLF